MVHVPSKKTGKKKSIAEKSLYLNTSIEAVLFEGITEYDARDAGFSVIKNLGLLPEDEIQKISLMGKYEKNVYIGKLRGSNPDLSRGMTKGLREAVYEFITINEIPDDRILSIKNDAVFVVGNLKMKTLEINGVFFSRKNSFTSYHYIAGKEFYYNSVKNEITTKGVTLPKGDLYDFFCSIFNHMESSSNINTTLRYLTYVRNSYLKRSLPLDWYRNIDANSFILNMDGEIYQVDQISDEYLPFVEIESNFMKYILPLIQRVLE